MTTDRTLAIVLVAAAFLLAAALPCAAETGVTHLVFDKSAKLKKIAATLYLSFAAAGGGGGAGPALRCGVVARGKNGAIPVAGTLSLRLVGESAGGAAVWRSATVAAPVDDLGDARFAAADVAELAAGAPSDAEIRLLEVGFKGGRGGRASELTVDCLPEVES